MSILPYRYQTCVSRCLWCQAINQFAGLQCLCIQDRCAWRDLRALGSRVQAATGEDVSAEDLGGAQLHCSTSGVTDHLAESEEHAIAIARGIVGNLGAAGRAGSAPAGVHAFLPWAEPLHPPEELRGMPATAVRSS